MQWFYWCLLATSACLCLVVFSIRCRSRLWLSGYMAFVVGYLGLILLDAQDFYISPKLYFCFLPIVFLPGPLLLGYISHISTRNYVGTKDFVLCLLPLMIVLAAGNQVSDVGLWQPATQLDYQQDSYISLFSLITMMAGLQTSAYVFASFRLMMRLRSDWASYQSKTLPRSWFRMMLAILVILITTITQVASAFMNPSGNDLSLGDIGFIVLVLFFTWMSVETAWRNFKGYELEEAPILQTTEVVAREPEDLEVKPDDTKDDSAADPDPLAQQVRNRVEQEQLYLNDDLSLASLANQLGMTTHKLSELINQQFNLSFYEFINDFRVHYAAARMLEMPALSVTDIYIEAGFTSKSTFYGYFKKAYGCTPSEYRKNNKTLN